MSALRRRRRAKKKTFPGFPGMPFQKASQALAGLTVLDLTRVRSGPTAVRQLADWGADVIKIETPAHLETGDPAGGPRHGPDFQNLHRNKRSITLNLKEKEGLAVLRRLVAKADVVVENFRPDVKERLGIDYATLRKINARIVYASISGFGQDGPYRERPGFDQIAQGMGGLMSITGLPGQGPVRVGIPIDDLCAGLLLSQAMLTLDDLKPAKGGFDTARLFDEIFAFTEEIRAAPRDERSGHKHRARIIHERRRAPKINRAN